MRLRPRTLSAVLIAVTGALLAGCSSAPVQQTVFTVMTGFTGSFPAKVDEIVDIGLPGLYNNSDQPVRLWRVELVGQPPAVHLLNVRAYSIKQVGYGDVGGQMGDLPAECPKQFVPHPVSSFTVPPRKASGYFAVIAFTISRPGRYHLGRAKIYYTISGAVKWQYQNLNITVNISNPPRLGPRPLPTSAVCGHP